MATIKVCDICGSSEYVNTREYVIGDVCSIIDHCESETYDICVFCENQILKSIINYLSNTNNSKYETNKLILSFIKNMI